MSTATGGSRATWTSSLAMCCSLIILGALGAAGWQLPAPQDKSQASKAGFKGTAAPFGTRCLDMSISNKGRKRSLKAC